MSDQTPENATVAIEVDTNKIKQFFAKHKTTIILGTALAVSVAINVVRTPFPKIADANWYALSHDDVEYLNTLLEDDQKL